MTNSFETIVFPTQTKTKIGKITYIINSYFDDNSESLKEKIKHLLITDIQNFSEKQIPNQ